MGIGLGIILLVLGLILLTGAVDLSAIDEFVASETLGWILVVGGRPVAGARAGDEPAALAHHARRGAPRGLTGPGQRGPGLWRAPSARVACEAPPSTAGALTQGHSWTSSSSVAASPPPTPPASCVSAGTRTASWCSPPSGTCPTSGPRCPRASCWARRRRSPRTCMEQQWYDEHDVDLRTGTEVTAIDLDRRQVHAGAESVPYERLLIATGATPRRLADLEDAGVPVAYLRTIDDSVALKAALRAGPRRRRRLDRPRGGRRRPAGRRGRHRRRAGRAAAARGARARARGEVRRAAPRPRCRPAPGHERRVRRPTASYASPTATSCAPT